MKLGFFTMPIHPLEKDWRLSLKEDREAFLLADELGFTEGYVGEHVTDQAENITSCVAFLAWIAAATRQIKLGTGTINMPNTHPATVAASIAMLDHMLGGRLIFGISPGGLLSDAELFGNLDADRNAMFLEAINQVLNIWESEPPYNIQGQYWNISTEKTLMRDVGQGIIARPLQRPHPPIVVTAVAPFSKGVTAAAARGWDWRVELVSNPDPVLAASDEVVATADSVILDRCERWVNLARLVVAARVPGASVVDLSAP